VSVGYACVSLTVGSRLGSHEILGLLGAGGVAIWFLGVDLIAGLPFRTPGMLGSALLNAIGQPGHHGVMLSTAVYTVFHVAAFVAVGGIAARLVDLARRVPHVTIGLLLFFVVFEVGFYFVTMVLAQYETMGSLAWYQIGAANLVAAGLMGGYLWRRHPELKSELRVSLDGSI